MKLRFLTQLSVFLMIVMLAAGCRSNRVISYPGSTKRSSSVGSLPPGQAKKVFGHQSAKAFAPGQQKKMYGKSNDNGKGNGKGKSKSKGKKN